MKKDISKMTNKELDKYEIKLLNDFNKSKDAIIKSLENQVKLQNDIIKILEAQAKGKMIEY